MRRNADTVILEHYKRLAKNFGDSGLCSMEDPYVREQETNFIAGEIELILKKNKKLKKIKVLDVGCGNGHLLQQLRERFPNIELYGLEFTPELYEIAHKRLLQNYTVIQGDARKEDWFADIEFDVIVTERSIINILGRKDQMKTLQNIYNRLKKGGRYIMVESFRSSLEVLNDAREEMKLEPLKESYQNKYLVSYQVEQMLKMGFVEIKGHIPSNFLSSHFFITRVFHKSSRPDGGKVKYTHFAHFFTQALPPAIGDYSPIQFHVFQK
jgi:SAM-dependent methyltransferase